MKFQVELLDFAKKDISKISSFQQELLKSDYKIIEENGIEFVKIKPLQKGIFEIKSTELRSLFKYKEGKIILIGVVFVKKTQKTPKEIIQLAKKRLKEY